VTRLLKGKKTDQKLFISAHNVFYPKGMGLTNEKHNVVVPSLYAPPVSSVNRGTGATTIGPFIAVPDRRTIYGLVVDGALSTTGAYYNVGLAYPTVASTHYINGIGIPNGTFRS
jgi:hypothetical protein